MPGSSLRRFLAQLPWGRTVFSIGVLSLAGYASMELRSAMNGFLTPCQEARFQRPGTLPTSDSCYEMRFIANSDVWRFEIKLLCGVLAVFGIAMIFYPVAARLIASLRLFWGKKLTAVALAATAV